MAVSRSSTTFPAPRISRPVPTVPSSGVSLVDYIQLIVAVTKIDAAIMASESGSTLRGGWELLRDPLVETWDAVTETITSAANNLVGNTAAATSEAGARLSLDAAKQALLRQTVNWTAQVFGDAAANALFAVEGGGPAVINGTVQAGNLQLGGLIGTTLAWAMTAYLIYSVVMILIRILWTCEEEEFELGVQRELRTCHYVGSYCDSEILGICIEKQKAFCCFNTPLARIINEQAYPQLGRSWGEPEHPNCRGLSLQESMPRRSGRRRRIRCGRRCGGGCHEAPGVFAMGRPPVYEPSRVQGHSSAMSLEAMTGRRRAQWHPS